MKIGADEIIELQNATFRIRKAILDLSFGCAGPAHLGGGLSIVEIVTALYKNVMRYDFNNPRDPSRDRFILSKGHGVLGFYPVLAEVGIIEESKLATFKHNGSDLIAHPVMNLDLGIESSNGSLGHGLSLGVGISLAALKSNQVFHTFVLMGDGECNEGSVWEAAMSAVQYRLGNLTAIIDNNGLQSDGKSEDIIEAAALSERWRGFGWEVVTVDGHNFSELINALTPRKGSIKPTVVIAKTTKGKGVSFMENNNEWHHNRLTKSMYDKAVLELEESQNV